MGDESKAAILTIAFLFVSTHKHQEQGSTIAALLFSIPPNPPDFFLHQKRKSESVKSMGNKKAVYRSRRPLRPWPKAGFFLFFFLLKVDGFSSAYFFVQLACIFASIIVIIKRFAANYPCGVITLDLVRDHSDYINSFHIF